jgi:hypothetical protein
MSQRATHCETMNVAALLGTAAEAKQRIRPLLTIDVRPSNFVAKVLGAELARVNDLPSHR